MVVYFVLRNFGCCLIRCIMATFMKVIEIYEEYSRGYRIRCIFPSNHYHAVSMYIVFLEEYIVISFFFFFFEIHLSSRRSLFI